MYRIGFDIGGSRTKAVLVKNRKIVGRVFGDTPKNLKALLNKISGIYRTLINQSGISASKISGIGFAFPGAMDKKREKILFSPNLRYLNNKPIKRILEKKLGIRVKIEHDVHCFLLAEKKFGLAKKLKNVFYLTLGTGVGSAWMNEGKIYLGAHGSAGEAGHMIIANSKEQIVNRKAHDLESLASEKFLKKMTGKSAWDTSRLVKKGDKKMRQVYEKLGENLGFGLVNIINILNPEVIILSGGISNEARFFLPQTKKIIQKYVTSPLAKKTKVVVSKLGQEAGALGAAMLFN